MGNGKKVSSLMGQQRCSLKIRKAFWQVCRYFNSLKIEKKKNSSRLKIYPSYFKSWFLTASTLLQNSCSRSRLASRAMVTRSEQRILKVSLSNSQFLKHERYTISLEFQQPTSQSSHQQVLRLDSVVKFFGSP